MEAAEYERRIKAIRGLMASEGIDALLGYADYKHGGHVQYLSGYQVIFGGFQSVRGTDHVLFGRAIVGLFMDGPPVLFTDTFFGSFGAEVGDYAAVEPVSTLDFPADIKRVFDRRRLTRGVVGIAGWDIFPAPVYLQLKESLPSVKLSQSTILDRVRMIKSPAEIALMREAERITDMGVEAARATAVPGNTEKNVAVAAEGVLRTHGDMYISTPADVCSGFRTANYISIPTNKKLERGDIVKVDIGARYQMYSGDISRSWVLGEPTKEQKRILDTVLNMNLETIARIKPSVRAVDLAAVARGVALEAGFEDQNIARLVGHGVGLDIHEPPDYGVAETVIEPNMVFTVEPTLMVPGVGGARIEDLILVTRSGAEVLSKSAKRLW